MSAATSSCNRNVSYLFPPKSYSEEEKCCIACEMDSIQAICQTQMQFQRNASTASFNAPDRVLFSTTTTPSTKPQRPCTSVECFVNLNPMIATVVNNGVQRETRFPIVCCLSGVAGTLTTHHAIQWSRDNIPSGYSPDNCSPSVHNGVTIFNYTVALYHVVCASCGAGMVIL